MKDVPDVILEITIMVPGVAPVLLPPWTSITWVDILFADAPSVTKQWILA